MNAHPQHTYSQRDFLYYLTALNVALTVFGIIAGLAGHHAAVLHAMNNDPSTAPLTWMVVGIVALAIGVPGLMVQFFLLAYRRPAA